jgi:hypothetical protein
MSTWNIDKSEKTFEAEAFRTPVTKGVQSVYYLTTKERPELEVNQLVFNPLDKDHIGFIVKEILPIAEGYRLNLAVYVSEHFVCWTGKNELGRLVKESGAVSASSRASAISQARAKLERRGYTDLEVN